MNPYSKNIISQVDALFKEFGIFLKTTENREESLNEIKRCYNLVLTDINSELSSFDYDVKTLVRTDCYSILEDEFKKFYSALDNESK